MLDTSEPLDAASVDWRGLRSEASRKLDRATKKVAKKSAKTTSSDNAASVEALKRTEEERDALKQLVEALNALDGARRTTTC